ncbi:hypothetical protein PMAYCL1PPCAC_32155, partial [Pristionchus mayeri]
RSRAMYTSLLVYTINSGSVVLSVVQLCVAASIFDFIVMNKKYYESVDQAILIDPDYALNFYCAPLLSAALGLLAILAHRSPTIFKSFFARHNTLLAATHSLILGAAAIAFAQCSLLASRLSIDIEPYALNGTPQNFQDASCWYFLRLRASMALFGLQSVFALAQMGFLYSRKEIRFMGITHQQYAKIELF